MKPRFTYPPQVVDTARARLPQQNSRPRQIETGSVFKLTKGFSPVMLTSGEVTLAAGAIAVPDHGKLQPIERTAMLVDEIHFNFRVLNNTDLSVDPRWLVRAKISMGRYAVTNEFVPLCGLEYVHLSNSMRASKALASTDYAGYSFTGCRWKLPTPLYVPAGTALFTQFQTSSFYYFTTTTTNTTVGDVTYIGRLLPVDYPVPKTIRVPYVTAIQSKDAANLGDTQKLLESKDLQLGNPFDVPMYAQRMIMANYETNGYGGNNVFVEAYDGGSPLVTLRGTFNNVDISIANLISHYKVFDDGITPLTLGTLGHHTLNLYNLEMQPKDRFDLTIDSRAVNLTPSTVVAASLIGWRNEVL